jgi:hypothetical protein
MQEGEEWCDHHGRHRREHLAQGKCTTVLSNGVWCRNLRPEGGGYRCYACSEEAKIAAEKEQLRQEQLRAAEVEREEMQCRTAMEDAALRGQAWFPALERLLEEREDELRRNIEEWVGEHYQRVPYHGW